MKPFASATYRLDFEVKVKIVELSKKSGIPEVQLVNRALGDFAESYSDDNGIDRLKKEFYFD